MSLPSAPAMTGDHRYSDQMGENLDLLVLGGWWGKGGRTGKISSLLCGLRIPQEDEGMGKIPEFVGSHFREDHGSSDTAGLRLSSRSAPG